MREKEPFPFRMGVVFIDPGPKKGCIIEKFS
jgi:hypothetical protein